MDERTLREVYLPHFREAVQRGHAASVMSAYNQVNGHYCAENAHLLHDILKGDWGFQASSSPTGSSRRAAPCRRCWPGSTSRCRRRATTAQPLIDAVANGEVSEATIDAAVRRILRASCASAWTRDPPQRRSGMSRAAAHAALALDVAREAIVLLKNDHGAVAARARETKSIVVVGALAAMANLGDHGSSASCRRVAVSPLDGICRRAGASR